MQGSDSIEQKTHGDFKSAGNFMKHADGWIYFSLFYTGIIGPVYMCPVGHIFLGQFLPLTDGNNSQTESSVEEVTVHNEKTYNRMPILV